jgi:GH15 family glucan-1,4-alpha-glucosidase
MLSEQVDPNSGVPLSVAPLTWSHAEFVVTVDDYVRKLERLRRARGPKKQAAAVT